MKKLICFLSVFILVINMCTFIVSASANNLNFNDKMEQRNNELTKYLLDNQGKGEINTLVDNYFKDHEIIINKEDVKYINKKSFKLLNKVDINNYISVSFYENGLFSIDKSAIVNLASNITSGKAYKKYYSWAGIHIFTVSVESKFNYNGNSATYGGGFDAYYERGFVSLWSVNNWSSGHNAAGNNYEAKCSGNFCIEINAGPIHIALNETHVKHNVTCDKDGRIATTMIAD